MSSDPQERYTALTPLTPDQSMRLVALALWFCAPENYHKICQFLSKTSATHSILPLSGRDFMEYLKKHDLLGDPDRYVYRVRDILGRMKAANLLVEMLGSDQHYVMIPQSYYALSELSSIRAQGVLWMATVLGSNFLYHQISSTIVQIVGKNLKGDERAGSGVIIDDHHVITCGHVVRDMKINSEQVFQNVEHVIDHDRVAIHAKSDLAVIPVRGHLHPVPGLALRPPVVTQKVYSFGFPRVPSIRSSPLIVQSGEVTADDVMAFDGSRLFLYSAIVRPGNSGGAIVSDDGYLLGIATDLRAGEYNDEGSSSPHFAGIPADAIAHAIEEMGLDVRVPYETFQ